jgi:hypothetical protein
MEQPQVSSHFPAQAHFASFPTDINTCLADDSSLPEEPPLCGAAEDPARPPHAELCVYGRCLARSIFPTMSAQTSRAWTYAAWIDAGLSGGQVLFSTSKWRLSKE